MPPYTACVPIRLIGSFQSYRLEPYWLKGSCGLRRKSDNKHIWLASEGESSGGIRTNIGVCNLVVPWL